MLKSTASPQSSESKELKEKFRMLLKARWGVFLFALPLVGLVSLTGFPFLSYLLLLTGTFLLLNLLYSFLFLKKSYSPFLLSLSFLLDFVLIAAADFFSAGLYNNLVVVFYLFLITGSACLISLRSARFLIQLSILFSLLLFFLRLFPPRPFLSLSFSPTNLSNQTLLLESLLQRTVLFTGLFFLLRHFFTQRDKERKYILEETEKINSALENLGDGLLLLDAEGRVLRANRQASKLIGAKPELLIGKILFADAHSFPVTLEFLNGPPINWVKAVREKKVAQKYELKALLPLEEKHIQLTLAPILLSNKIEGIIGLLEDITKARRLDEMKTDFISTVSHELRTPLTTIKGYTSLLLSSKGKFDEQKRFEFLTLIDNQAERLAQLINNLLDVSRLEAGRLELRRQPIQIKNLIEKVVVNFRLPDMKQRVVTSFPPRLPLVFADPDRIEQVFTNLIDNALKYSPPDKPVRIEGRVNGEELVVTVEDQGIGIHPYELPYIFEKFHRVERSSTSEISGTGLGLYIVKTLMEIHGGKIWCESLPKKGSKFFVSLPIYSGNLET